MKIYLCFKLYQAENYILDHFINYYKKLGIHGMIANFSYFHPKLEEGFDEFVNETTQKYPMIFSVGPNLISAGSSTKELQRMAKESDADYIIPADLDEFHEYPYSLEETISYMKDNELNYLSGCTVERVSETGECIELTSDRNIFDQFPKDNQKLFCMPKISIMTSECYQLSGCGHHYIEKSLIEKNNLKNKYVTKTHHFRWSKQGKKRMENWLEIFNYEFYKGWKNLDQAQKKLDAFNGNLLEYSG